MGCMFIPAGAEEGMLLNSKYYCGFEDYRAQLTGQTATDTFDNMSLNENVAQIVSENAYAGEKALKICLDAKGITAFEIRNSSPFELEKQEYSITFAYKTNVDAEISLGMAKAGNVPGTAYAINKMSAQAGDNWQTATLNFTADKSFDEGYVPAIIVYAENETEIYFDDIIVEALNGKAYTSMPEITFDSAWYPTLKKPSSISTEELQIWDGTVAEFFAGGSGSEGDPYLISNGKELALAITNGASGETYTDCYFKITKDIYLNDLNAINWENGTLNNGYTAANKWYTRSELFAGTIDGDGHTIYGLYRNDNPSSYESYKGYGTALIPRIVSGGTVTISNLAVDYCYINVENGASAFIASDYGAASNIDNCMVGANVILKGGDAGAFVGFAAQSTTTITNSCSLAALVGAEHYGLLGYWLSSEIVIKNSYNATGPINSGNKSKYPNSFSSKDNYQAQDGVIYNEKSTTVSAVNMQGADVFTNADKMPNLNSSGVYTATEGYPVLTTFIKEVDAEAGEEIEIWDGSIATEFAKGSGSAVDPYIISDGAELALAVSGGGGNDVYYEITKDIYLNDISKINWYTGAVLKTYKKDGLNTWYGGTTAFSGNVNGNGHSIYGLYRNEANSVKGYNTNYKWGAGLFPTVAAGNTLNVTNLTVDYCYINAECNASVFVGFASGGATLNFDGIGVGENITLTGGRTGLFHAYSYASNIVNVNIDNSYSLAKTTVGFVGTPARTNASIKNSYFANGTIVAGSVKDTVTLENCYQSVQGSYTSGVTTLDLSNMKGIDALTDTSKMSGLDSSIFEAKNRSYYDTEHLVFLPKGSIISNGEIKAVYDNMCAPISTESAVVDNSLVKDAYVWFATIPDESKILVPAEYISFVRQGSRNDLIKADYYYDIASDRITKKVDKFGDKTVNYIFMSDLHYEGDDTSDSSTGERTAMLREAAFVAEWASNDDSIDFVILGGDLIDGNNKKAKSLQYLNEILAPFLSCTKPVMVLMGNHDDNTYSGTFSFERVISDKDWNDNVIDFVVNKNGDFAKQDSKDQNSKYYYYDIDSKKIRVVCLDASDYYNEYDENGNVTYLEVRYEDLAETDHDRYRSAATFHGYSDRQLQWLVEEALTAEEGWDYVFTSHQGIDENTNASYSIYNGTELRAIISAFQNGTSYTNETLNITADYSDNTAKILSYQFGHTHKELVLYEDDVKLWQINTESSNYDEVGDTRTLSDKVHNLNLNWVLNLHERSSESEANFDVMSVCRDFVYKQSIGIGITEKLYNPGVDMAGDMNDDGMVDIRDLVEQNLVINGLESKTTSADTDKNSIFDADDLAALRKIIVE